METTTTKLPGCQFDLSWIGKCGKPLLGELYCKEHSEVACSSCGAKATRDCEETMGLVCGAPLCDDCEHTTCLNGCNSGAPLPFGLRWHCKKADQIYKPWYSRENERDVFLKIPSSA